MLDNGATETSVFKNHYRCPDAYDVFNACRELSQGPGFFRFGNAVCYGRSALPNHPVIENGAAILPFDPREIIENLRCERYATDQKSLLSRALQKAYYTVRPVMGVALRKHLQRAYMKNWRQIRFPCWPVDRTVEDIFEELLLISLNARGEQEMPFVWFWPKGYRGCLMLTHDIESAAGRDYSPNLADLDQSFGMKCSFQVVPEDSYEVTPAFLERLRLCGAEINLHGLTHDGQLFRNRRQFLEQAKGINQYAKLFGAAGFRSPVLYRNVDWFSALNVSYDMSVPNVAHLDPQRGGCCTVFPYYIGEIVELPLTLSQDYTLFHILNERSIGLWEQQIDLILEKHGLLSFNVHPDYIMAEPFNSLYRRLLQVLERICRDRNIWIAQPAEVNQWWRDRQNMQIVTGQDRELEVTGPGSESARVAFARVQEDRIIYEVGHSRGHAPCLQCGRTE